jgi:hypothetical protein
MTVLAGMAHAHGPTIEISHHEMKPPLLNLSSERPSISRTR